MNPTLRQQVCAIFGLPQPTRYYALPDGGVTSNRTEAREAWEWHRLIRNVTKCNTAGKAKYCAGRL